MCSVLTGADGSERGKPGGAPAAGESVVDVQVGTAQVFSVSLYFSLCLSVCNHAASLCTSSRCLNSAFVSISSVSLTPYQALLWSSLIPPSSLLFDAFCRLTYMGHQSRVPNADDLPIVSLSLPLTLFPFLSVFISLPLSVFQIRRG